MRFILHWGLGCLNGRTNGAWSMNGCSMGFCSTCKTPSLSNTRVATDTSAETFVSFVVAFRAEERHEPNEVAVEWCWLMRW